MAAADGPTGTAPGLRGRRRGERRPLVTDVRRLVAETVVVCGALVLAYALLPLDDDRWAGRVVGVVVIVSVVPLVVRRVGRVLRADRPVAEAVAAVAVTATLAVMAFSGIYYAMSVGDPGEFNGLGTKVDGVYFTVTVMTTTGFGDIVPTSQVARLVTTLHIVFTVALLGAAFRLFGWAARRRLSDDRT